MDVFNGYDLVQASLVVSIRRQGGIPKGVDGSPVIPVAADGGGNLFLLSVCPPFAIWKWDHEVGATCDGWLPNGHEALSAVCTGFGAFLAQIVKDWEHFVYGDVNWPYLAG